VTSRVDGPPMQSCMRSLGYQLIRILLGPLMYQREWHAIPSRTLCLASHSIFQIRPYPEGVGLTPRHFKCLRLSEYTLTQAFPPSIMTCQFDKEMRAGTYFAAFRDGSWTGPWDETLLSRKP